MYQPSLSQIPRYCFPFATEVENLNNKLITGAVGIFGKSDFSAADAAICGRPSSPLQKWKATIFHKMKGVNEMLVLKGIGDKFRRDAVNLGLWLNNK